MKVYELIAHLQQQPQQAEVVLDVGMNVYSDFGVHSFPPENVVYIAVVGGDEE